MAGKAEGVAGVLLLWLDRIDWLSGKKTALAVMGFMVLGLWCAASADPLNFVPNIPENVEMAIKSLLGFIGGVGVIHKIEKNGNGGTGP